MDRPVCFLSMLCTAQPYNHSDQRHRGTARAHGSMSLGAATEPCTRIPKKIKLLSQDPSVAKRSTGGSPMGSVRLSQQDVLDLYTIRMLPPQSAWTRPKWVSSGKRTSAVSHFGFCGRGPVLLVPSQFWALKLPFCACSLLEDSKVPAACYRGMAGPQARNKTVCFLLLTEA